MDIHKTKPFEERNAEPLRRTSTRITQFPGAADFETSLSQAYNRHIPDQSDDTYILPTSVYGKSHGDQDAHIAARRAMAKRSSRSFSSRVSRIRSRKEKHGRPARPGIKVDTSFTRHKGNIPRQLYPQESQLPIARTGGTIKKTNWWSLGRPKSGKGLGITRGDVEQSTHIDENMGHEAAPKVTTYNLKADQDPTTADSLAPGNRAWFEISPSDGPIPIGISIPSDSIPDFSPYQSTRHRSESDATLVTPSIVITPAVMKSVWSPDTESDYTPGRSSSVYSRSMFNIQSTMSDVPPVPALPSNILGTNDGHPSVDVHNGIADVHARNNTLDSAVTTFEEDNYLMQKDRVTSTSTVFEEDETPLTLDQHVQTLSNLSIDTNVVPTPRRSRGWWNVITTPFELSRHNSVWTNNTIANGDRTPDVPLVPQNFGTTHGAVAACVNQTANKSTIAAVLDSATQQDPPIRHVPSHHAIQITSTNEPAITSPLSATTASPILRTAAVGTVIMPQEPRQINVNIELKDHRPGATAQAVYMPSHITASPASSPPALNPSHSPDVRNVLHRPVPQFDPPPAFAQPLHKKRADDMQSLASSAPSPDLKNPKTHRKVSLMEWFQRKTQSGKRNQTRKSGDKKKRKSRRCCCLWSCCCILFLCLLAIIIPIIVVLTRRHNHASTPTNNPSGRPNEPSHEGGKEEPPSQWLNLTGFPPIPTGISTIAQPEAVKEVSGCVSPATIWSCALPKEDQPSIAPNKPDQPNFKLEIVFENSTITDPTKTRPAKRAANAVSVGAFIRSRLLYERAAPSPSPAPPPVDDQSFLGNTTDGNTLPFEGEQTPFFVSFISPLSTSKRLAKRADIGNITDVIPPPSVNNDGTAAAANLLPFPSSQPLKLYNRGKDNEYYGFYTYFDRSIFLKSIQPSNSSFGGVPADTAGGSPFDAASLRCTWSQTRFLVQIWTRSESTKPLLQGLTKPSLTSSPQDNIKRPGSFPYPVTITIDRHGGNNTDKMIYCYEMDKSGKILTNKSNKKFVLEDRSFGGVPVNPSQGPFKDPGGVAVDGGTGGCSCQWQNWLA
ncbi:hypothetical protein GQ43DRAFT_365126 [Delitschia confertaspora ATCC 74209]|uniref:Glycoprotease family protein n=1 Tax=Delitschia confertaspora ATCC 74209 TaxID=1513339 RepID=A0A9P4JR58_9PLEO|nr:hypothetical protein GQ43DRAFT_365126 [Delitschia confertaspora ATCC 74209]